MVPETANHNRTRTFCSFVNSSVAICKCAFCNIKSGDPLAEKKLTRIEQFLWHAVLQLTDSVNEQHMICRSLICLENRSRAEHFLSAVLSFSIVLINMSQYVLNQVPCSMQIRMCSWCIAVWKSTGLFLEQINKLSFVSALKLRISPNALITCKRFNLNIVTRH